MLKSLNPSYYAILCSRFLSDSLDRQGVTTAQQVSQS
ncbi:Uncharacterised protein [Vibrio cholerae]|nr:Uncharacterised protein [Vibrio cholerae]